MHEAKRLAVTTLGCKVNQYDTDSVVTQFLDAGTVLWISGCGRCLLDQYLYRDESG